MPSAVSGHVVNILGYCGIAPRCCTSSGTAAVISLSNIPDGRLMLRMDTGLRFAWQIIQVLTKVNIDDNGLHR